MKKYIFATVFALALSFGIVGANSQNHTASATSNPLNWYQVGPGYFVGSNAQGYAYEVYGAGGVGPFALVGHSNAGGYLPLASCSFGTVALAEAAAQADANTH